MENISKNNDLDYVEKSVKSLQEILSSNKRDLLETINRTNKGELFVLQFLTMHDKNVLPSELSTALQSSTARISALLGVLEKKGQIVRKIDKNNRRNILVMITEDGRKRVETEMSEMKNKMSQVFIEMGKKDTEDFIRLAHIFFEIMQKHFSQEQL